VRSHAGTPHGSHIPEEWPREAALPAFVCTNCGFWQKFFETPSTCPICGDYRHVLPAHGWSFLGLEEARGLGRCVFEEVENGIWRYGTETPLGIAPLGYVIVRPEGNVGFEGTGWYDEAALEHIESIGGIRYLSASHPHSYGALWQLRERFEPEVILQAEDLPWATAFPPTWTFDERLRIGDDAELLCTGGHFAGHTMLYLPERKIVFVGDALKFEIDPSDERRATGVSTHKAFVRRIPLTRREVERYREVFAALDFEQAWTPFDQCCNVGREEVLAFLDSQLRGRPFVDAVPL
jgi:hypothetical protein